MRHGVSAVLLVGVAIVGESFLFAGPRNTLQCAGWSHQHQHVPALGASLHPSDTCRLPTVRRPSSLACTTASDASTQQNLPLPSTGIASVEESGGAEGQSSDPGNAAAGPSSTRFRTGVAVDGTALTFRAPSSQDLHKLQMGSWVAKKGLAVSLVALERDGEAESGDAAMIGVPLAGTVVEAIRGEGGSSAATRVCLLRERSVDGVSEAVEHALLDETINQFLNDGARINQVRRLRADVRVFMRGS